jgi:hypothetical protein
LYRFDYWTTDGGAVPTHIASFAPEFNDAQVGTIHGGTEVTGAIRSPSSATRLVLGSLGETLTGRKSSRG